MSLYGIVADLRRTKQLPPGGKPVLDELVGRARAEGVYDLDYGPDPYDKPPLEPLDEGTAGIGAILVGTSLIGILLAAAAVYLGINAIVHSSG